MTLRQTRINNQTNFFQNLSSWWVFVAAENDEVYLFI